MTLTNKSDDQLIDMLAHVLFSAAHKTLTDEEVQMFWDVKDELERRMRKAKQPD